MIIFASFHFYLKCRHRLLAILIQLVECPILLVLKLVPDVNAACKAFPEQGATVQPMVQLPAKCALVRPDQIDLLFHGSGGSIFLES